MEASPAFSVGRHGVPDGDDILGRAVRFLIEGGENEAAARLVDARLHIGVYRVYEGEPWEDSSFRVSYSVEGSRAVP